MDAFVEDRLLRMAVVAEVNNREDAEGLLDAYERLLAAHLAGESLGTVLAVEAERALEEDVEAQRIAAGVGDDDCFLWVHTETGVESLHGLGELLDSLRDVGAVTPHEIEAFLDRRRAVCSEDADALRAVADEINEKFYATYVDSEPFCGSMYVDPGMVHAILPGHTSHVDGVRVMATELGAEGTVVHVHEVREQRTRDLRLYDDLGTEYQGGIPVPDAEDEPDPDDPMPDSCGFVPAMPPAAGRLWLASLDGSVRIELR